MVKKFTILRVLDLIPDEGIQFKDLNAKRKMNKIAYLKMLESLKILQKEGTVKKEAVIKNGRAVALYKRVNLEYEHRAFIDINAATGYSLEPEDEFAKLFSEVVHENLERLLGGVD